MVDHGVASPFSQIDHFPVYVTVKITKPITKSTTKTVRDYHLLDADMLTNELLQTDWDNIINQNTDQATVDFTNAILSAADKAIPTRIIRTRPNSKPWYNNELKREARKRDRLFRKALKLQTDECWARWRRQRNVATELNKRLKEAYRINQVQQLLSTKNNPHKYHNILRQMTGKSKAHALPPLIKPDGETTTDDNDKANLLCNYFANQSILETSDKQIPVLMPESPVPILNTITITEREVLNLLNSLDVNKSCGPDNLPPKILKLVALLIVTPLTKLFNQSINQGHFPSIWKEAKVHAIFKRKGSASDPSSYRPISLLPCISKIFEKIIFNRIYSHITENNLLTDKQSGYRPHHSTHLQLVYLTHKLYSALDTGNDFTAIFLDISKYFDKIWHAGLLYKCKTLFGITGTLHTWLKSYLADRSIRVCVNDNFSQPRLINTGCPQGSVLGPLLALIYLNDLADITHNESLFYADDTSLYASYSRKPSQLIALPGQRPVADSNRDEVFKSLQTDLNIISNFGTDWLISFSAAKTKQVIFSHVTSSHLPSLSFDDSCIPLSSSHTHLGLTLSTDLRFHNHINIIIKKVNTALSPLYPIAKYLPRDILNQIYSTYILPIFDYSDIVYDGLITTKDKLRLERLHARAARLVTGALFNTSHNQLLLDLGWDTLETRRKKHRLIFYNKLINHFADLPQYIRDILPQTRQDNTGRALRNATNLTLPSNRTSLFKQSFIPKTTRDWNILPESIRTDPSLKSFQRAIETRLCAGAVPPYNNTGSKFGNIQHARLRLNATVLKAHLYQIQKSSSPCCECGSPKETVAHFVLNCPRFQVLRSELFGQVSTIIPIFNNCNSVSKLNLLLYGRGLNKNDQIKVAKLFQNYIIKTKRFQNQ